jgi:hypothetical protein
MSRQASEYLAQNLYDIRRATYTEGDKVRPLGETGLALLVYLCDATNKNGTFFMTAVAMKDEVGFSTLRMVRRVLAGLEQMGFITRTGVEISYEGRGRPTPEYALTLVPGLWKENTNERIGDPLGAELVSRGTLENRTKTNADKESAGFSFSEPEPQPQPHPEPRQVEGDQDGGRLERLIGRCIEREHRSMGKNPAGAPLVKKWQTEYRTICPQVMHDCPGYTDERLVERAWNIRKGIEVPPPAPRTNPDCHTCKGQPWVNHPTTGELGRCPVCYPEHTQGDTPKSVTAERAPNTDTPAPPAQADPRSNQVDDLTKRLRRVV